MPAKSTFVLGLWLMLLLLSGYGLVHTLQLQSDLSLFLPTGQSTTQRLLLNELHQGRATRLLLIGIAGGDAEGRAGLSQTLVGTLRDSTLFEQVANGAPGDIQVEEPLLNYRYLLTPKEELQRTFSEAGLRQALESRLSELRSPLPAPFKALLPRDPTQAYAGLFSDWRLQTRIARAAGVWASQDGTLAILLATTREGGLNLARQADAVATLEAAFARVNTHGEYRLILSGPGTFGVLSKQLIETESRQLSLLASGAIALLLLLAYRHPPYLLYASLPLVSGLLAASLITNLIFDSLHGITLAFGITLLGVTLDYPVHLFSHLTVGESAGQTMRRIWPTLRLGVITTCLGYFVLVTTDFAGLQQLGVFTLTGLFTAALASRYLLPRLMTTVRPRRPKTDRLLQLLQRGRWSPVMLLLVISLLAAVTLTVSPRLWNDDVAVLSPLPASLLAQDRYLRQQLMAEESNRMLLLQADDMEQLLRRCEALRPLLSQAVAAGLTAGASLPCDYLPSQRMQAQRQALIPPRQEMAARLERALEGLPFRPHAFDGFLDDLQASRHLPPLTYDELTETPLRERLDPLLKRQAEGWLALIPLRQVKRESVLAAHLQASPLDVSYVNLRQETSRLISGFRQEILQQAGLGMLVMLAVLWIGLGSLSRATAILLPIAAAILCTLALLVLRGEPMNLFHLISLMLVLGIGIDFSLFFSRDLADDVERSHTLHALTLCALSTASVFAILGSSAIPVLRAIGQTVAFGVSLSYFATYAFWHMPRNPSKGSH